MTIMLKVRKVGGSLMAVIPSEEAKKWNLSSGDTLSAELKPIRKDMFGALKGKLKPYNREEDRGYDRI